MTIISERKGFNFEVSSQFKSEYLAPIIKNLLYKAENEWDDYNEVYHCCQLIEQIKSCQNIMMDFHIMKHKEQCLGLALVSRGNLDLKTFFKEPIIISEAVEDILIFNYFHIAQEGRGNGEMWLKEIIQYYKHEDYQAIYLKSSHPKVFSLYSRLGTEIGEYSSCSDNNVFKRKGKIFKISL